MGVENTVPRTRRAVLTAGVAAAAAAVVPALGGQAQAANGDNAVLGVTNSATLPTVFDVGGNSGPAVKGSAATIGVQGIGDTAVWGESDGTNGVWGHSTSATGYAGGVSGQSDSPDGVGIWGWAPEDGSGAMGISGDDPTSASIAKTGVYGWAAQDSTAAGVRGETTIGIGVAAVATTGVGLQVTGRAKFNRAGKASVPAGKKNVDITVPGGLTSNSIIHATLQAYRAGVAVAGVRPNYPSAGKARIYLTKVASATKSTRVGWFVADH